MLAVERQRWEDGPEFKDVYVWSSRSVKVA